jgi:hypothetical protein
MASPNHLAILLAMVLLGLLTPAAGAQDRWRLTTSAFTSEDVQLRGIDAAAAQVAPAGGGEPRAVPMDELLQLRRLGAEVVASGPFVLHLHGGATLPGRPMRLEGETLHWQSPSLGEVAVAMQRVRGILRGNVPASTLDRDRTEDVARFVNGDVVRGIVDSITDRQLAIVAAGGQSATVELDALSYLLLAPAGEIEPDLGRAFRVELSDGSAFTTRSLASDAGGFRVEPLGATRRTIGANLVVAIEQVNGPVTWLSALPPTTSEHTPFFQASFPARMNRSVTGDPLRAGGRSFERGIGVHARSTMTWSLDAGYRTFRTQFALDDNQPLANVDVKILVDGKEAFAKSGVRSGELSAVVTLPVAGAKELTLVVDFGQNYDVQDRFNWIEPALLK